MMISKDSFKDPTVDVEQLINRTEGTEENASQDEIEVHEDHGSNDHLHEHMHLDRAHYTTWLKFQKQAGRYRNDLGTMWIWTFASLLLTVLSITNIYMTDFNQSILTDLVYADMQKIQVLVTVFLGVLAIGLTVLTALAHVTDVAVVAKVTRSGVALAILAVLVTSVFLALDPCKPRLNWTMFVVSLLIWVYLVYQNCCFLKCYNFLTIAFGTLWMKEDELSVRYYFTHQHPYIATSLSNQRITLFLVETLITFWMLIVSIDSYWVQVYTEDYNASHPHDEQVQCVIDANSDHDRYMLISGCSMACTLLQFVAILWMQDSCSFPILYFVIAFTNMTLIKEAIPDDEETSKNICIAFQVIIPVLSVLAGLQFYYLNQKTNMSIRTSTSIRI